MMLTTEKLSSPVYQAAMKMLSSGEETVQLLYEAILGNILARNVYLTCKNVENEGMKTYIVFEYTGIKTSEDVKNVQEKVENEPIISRYLDAYPSSSVSVYPSDNANNEHATDLTVSIYRLIDNQEDYNLPMIDVINEFNYHDYAMLHVAKYYNNEPLVNLEDIDKFVDMYKEDIHQVNNKLQGFYPGQEQYSELYAAYLLGVQHALNSIENNEKKHSQGMRENDEDSKGECSELLRWNSADVLVEYHDDNYYALRTNYCVVRTTQRFNLYHTVEYNPDKQVFNIKMFHTEYPHIAIEMHKAHSMQEVKQYILHDIQMGEQEIQSRVEIRNELYKDYYGFSHY